MGRPSDVSSEKSQAISQFELIVHPTQDNSTGHRITYQGAYYRLTVARLGPC